MPFSVLNLTLKITYKLTIIFARMQTQVIQCTEIIFGKSFGFVTNLFCYQ